MCIRDRSFGVYIIKGSINVQLAEKTGFSDDDADKVKKALITLFANDASSARPEGSMDLKPVSYTHLYGLSKSGADGAVGE